MSVKKKSLTIARYLCVYRKREVGLILCCHADPSSQGYVTDARLEFSKLGSERLVHWWMCQSMKQGIGIPSAYSYGKIIKEDSIEIIKEICLLKPDFKMFDKEFR